MNPMFFPGRALGILKSDNALIPKPAIAVEGTDTGVGVNQIIDGTKDFVAIGVYAGDIIYNNTTGAAATVINNPSPTKKDTLDLNAGIFTGAGDSYTIYQASPQGGGRNEGCSLFVGNGGLVRVTTVGGDDVTFNNVQDGTFLPVRVIKLWGTTTTATNILALW